MLRPPLKYSDHFLASCLKEGENAANVMEDEDNAKQNVFTFQETGQQQPARMVGQSGLEFSARSGMEAGSQAPFLSGRGEQWMQ